MTDMEAIETLTAEEIAAIEEACATFEESSKGALDSKVHRTIAETLADISLAPGIRKLIAHARAQQAALDRKDEVIWELLDAYSGLDGTRMTAALTIAKGEIGS